MSRVVFAGGRLESLVLVAGTPSDTVPGGGRFNATYADAALTLNNGDLVRTALFDSAMAETTVAAGHTLWLRFDWQSSHVSGQDGVILYGSDGYPYAKIRSPVAAADMQIFGNTGTGAVPAWTQIGANVSTPDARTTFDFALAIAASGPHTFTAYKNGVVTLATGTFTQAGLVDIASVDFLCWDQYAPTYLSQILATEDISTVGSFVKTSRATGAGAHSGWAGAYTDVNQAGDNNATANISDAAGQQQSYAMGDVTVPAGYWLGSVFHWLRAKNTGGNPSNIKSIARVASTDYIGASNMPTVGLGYGPAGARYDVNPATGVAWTQSGWNAAEMGFESAA